MSVIVELVAENIKRLRAVRIRPNGKVVPITGENGAGKSSVLDAIDWAFRGGDRIQADPIRGGAERALIRVDTGDLIIKRTFSRSKKEGGKPFTTSLTVEGADGTKYKSPQAVLDALVGALSFDPLDFILRMKPREQFDALRVFVPGVDFDAIDAANAADYAKRTDLNRQIKELQAQVAGISIASDLPATRIDESALLQEMASAGERSAEIEREKAHRAEIARTTDAARDQPAKMRQEAEDMRRRADALEREAADLEDSIAKMDRDLAAKPRLPEPVDMAGLREQIESAKKINQQIADRERRTELERRIAALDWEASSLTEAMQEREQEKRAAVAAAEMPVPGLTFGDGVVLLDGHPLEQASSAQQLRVSVALAMKQNPGLRVIRIKDGSLLDQSSMKLLAEMAEANDAQVWVERVTNGERVGFVIEDGEVREPAEAA